MSIWDFILLIVATEAITNIISKADIFYPVRKWLFKNFRRAHDLVDCPYCTSVWVATLLVFLSQVLSFCGLFKIIIYGAVIHRLSNVFHFIIDIIAPNEEEVE
jgi:hypothetical protein